MLFDEDTTLLSFFENFSDPEDEEELKENIIKYVGAGGFGGATNNAEETTTGESLDDVSTLFFEFDFLIIDLVTFRLCCRYEEKTETSNACRREIIGCCQEGGRTIQYRRRIFDPSRLRYWSVPTDGQGKRLLEEARRWWKNEPNCPCRQIQARQKKTVSYCVEYNLFLIEVGLVL